MLHKAARAAGRSLTATLGELLQTDEIKPKQRNTLKALMGDFARWRSQAAELPHTEVAEIVLEESGYTRMWQEDKSPEAPRSEEHTSELQSLMRISYAVFCLKKKKNEKRHKHN